MTSGPLAVAMDGVHDSEIKQRRKTRIVKARITRVTRATFGK